MMTAESDVDLLEVHRRTAFVLDDRGRMLHESSPDQSTGKPFSFTGCRKGNVAVIRYDVADLVADELEKLVAREPPLASADAVPIHLEDYRALLDADGAGVEYALGYLWVFPGPLVYRDDVDLVSSGSPRGDDVLARFVDAVQPSLAERGFREASDLWDPWCMALLDGRIVAIAETVRTGPDGVEVGVDTAVGYRGRGLGAAVTAGWSRHPRLEELTLFYSTSRANRSSQRVTERLALHFVGSTFAVG